jgi:hypothetical protein
MSIFGQTVEVAGGGGLFMAGPSGPARLLPEFLFSLYGGRLVKQKDRPKAAFPPLEG